MKSKGRCSSRVLYAGHCVKHFCLKTECAHSVDLRAHAGFFVMASSYLLFFTILLFCHLFVVLHVCIHITQFHEL